ncbi:MAG: hypothetical protein AAB957_00920 [Patescibacteria group bacterium]
MKNKLFLFSSTPLYLFAASPVSVLEIQTLGDFQLIINIITLIIVGKIIYSLWVNLSGFGGMLGKSLKIMSAGIFLLSINTIIRGVPKYNLDSLFGPDVYSNYLHGIITLAGFLVLGFGLASLTRLIKSMK